VNSAECIKFAQLYGQFATADNRQWSVRFDSQEMRDEFAKKVKFYKNIVD
jgi:hypothetical protein